MTRPVYRNTVQRARTFRAALLVTTALTGCVLAAAPAGATDWTGAIGDWFDPSNWNSGVPTSGEQANINNGGTAQVGAEGAASSVWIGQNAGQSGALEVTGPDAALTAASGVFVGFSGSGTLDISGGGVINSGGTTIAATGTSTGSVTVDGDGSALNSAGFTVGNEGEGTLSITNGGYVFSTSSAIGFGSAGSGAVTIDGAGSLWESLYSLYVGYEGSAALDIANGGAMSSHTAYVGFVAGSTGAVTVDGAGSSWAATWDLNLGHEGEGSLDISGGGTVTSNSGYIGREQGSSGAVTVDGHGSSWTMENLSVGDAGSGTLDISGGAAVESAGGYIGRYGSSIGIVTVDGTESTWTNDGSLYVGNLGTGTLNITGGGAVNGTDFATFAGFLAGSSGTVTVDGEGSTWTSSGTLYLGYLGEGSLTVANGASVSHNLISVAATEISVGTINIGAAMGEAAVGAGTLDAVAIGFGAGSGSLVFNHTDTDYHLGADINGWGVISQIGSGSTTLSGNSSGFSGTTTVEGGALVVNGLLGGSIDVANARLGGSGRVGSTVLGAGAVIAPGNSVGVLTVAGNLTFDADSTYEVEVDTVSRAADLIYVTGIAYLNGASVAHVGNCGCYPWYMTQTILTADGGIDGTFGGITSDFAFLTPDLAYDANNVRMTLLRNDVDFSEVSKSPNQKGVASAASGLGQGNPIYDEILMMTEEEARAAFDALSGEAYASAGSAAFNAAQQLRDLLQMRLQMFSGSKVASAGFVPAAGDALAADATAIWGQVFGSNGTSDATATSARLDRRSAGFIGGADKAVGEDTRVGFALGYSRSNFDVSSLVSSGGSDNFHLMGYAGTKLGAVDLGATLGYSYGRADAERTVVVGGLTENLTAEYDSHTFQASVEAGTDLAMGPVVLTPFAGLAVTHVETGSFTETGGSSALSFASSSNTTGLSTLGLRVRREAGGVTLAGSAAWRHAFGDVEPVSRAAFASAPASPFSVRGTAVAEDALALEAGIGLRLDEGTRLTLGYSGEYASGSRDNGLKAELRVEF
ncbi:MAG: autotransporter domain-containing protein [Parvibaculum sp.]|nr:autotransporter domain-containing protein [Parvibaculum sp.]